MHASNQEIKKFFDIVLLGLVVLYIAGLTMVYLADASEVKISFWQTFTSSMVILFTVMFSAAFVFRLYMREKPRNSF